MVNNSFLLSICTCAVFFFSMHTLCIHYAGVAVIYLHSFFFFFMCVFSPSFLFLLVDVSKKKNLFFFFSVTVLVDQLYPMHIPCSYICIFETRIVAVFFFFFFFFFSRVFYRLILFYFCFFSGCKSECTHQHKHTKYTRNKQRERGGGRREEKKRQMTNRCLPRLKERKRKNEKERP